VTLSRPQFEAPFTLGAQLEVRAMHPEVADRVFLIEDDRTWTYRQYRDEAVRLAHFLLGRLGRVDDARPGHVAMLLENHLELLALYAACGYAGLTLFGVNTGLRGETLAGVVNHARARVLVVDQRLHDEVLRVRRQLTTVAPENILVVRTDPDRRLEGTELGAAVTSEVGASGAVLEPPAVTVEPTQVLKVIYTSGTTGLPKGIQNNHFKFLAIGLAVSRNLGLEPQDRGYACMPLFHSNALFLGFQPAFHVCGSLVLRPRFSASAFVPDILRHGVTYWNYVGEPMHYILSWLEKEYGGDEARIRAALTDHPRRRLRYALGNGAAAPDIERFERWFGVEEVFELYGSTEAAITTFRRKGDPRGCVGEITDPDVKILNERGAECPPAALGADGKIQNYAEAVGEICRVSADTGLFQGYFDNAEANQAKYRGGVYHSGDLGHVVVREGTRYLFFDGRTDDWIRKDGENFSAQQVARLVQEHPDVVLAAAYGVPSPVSDELVMVALKLRPGAAFDPQGFFDFCRDQVDHGSMDPKWFPDFVRLVDEFEYTQTQKILVRHLKRVHFDRRRLPDAPLYWRRRGDRAFRPLRQDDYEALREEFARAEKTALLDH
jgi:fatty-acyl-CoA synthase